MKKFFAVAATCLLALACANNNSVKVTDPDSDLAKVVENVQGDTAKAVEQAQLYIPAYAKALVEKIITQEQFDAFVEGLTEKAGVPAETVKSLVESAKAALLGTAEKVDETTTEAVDAANETVEAANAALNEAADKAVEAANDATEKAVNAANEAINKAAQTVNNTVQEGTAEAANAINNALKN